MIDQHQGEMNANTNNFQKFFLSILTSISLVFPLGADAQNAFNRRADSLILLAENEPTDTTKFDLFMLAARELSKVDRIAAIEVLADQLLTAKKMGDEPRMAEAASVLGMTYLYIGKNDSAMIYSQMANELYEKHDSIFRLIETLNNLAICYQRDNLYEESIEIFQRLVTLTDSVGDYIGEFYAHVNLMNIFIYQDDGHKALEYHYNAEKAIDKARKNEKSLDELKGGAYAGLLMNVGEAFSSIGILDSTKYYLEKAKEQLDLITVEYNRYYYQGYIFANLGSVIIKIGEKQQPRDSIISDSSKSFYSKSLKYFEDSHRAFQTIGDSRGEAIALSHLGSVLDKLGRHKQAKEKLEKALVLAKQLNFKEKIRDIYEQLAENATSQANYELANSYLKEWVIYRDSVRNEERDQITRQMEVKFKTAQKERRISELELQNKLAKQRQATQLTVFTMFVVFVIGAVYFLFTQFRIKKQQEKVDFERSVNQAMSRFVPMDFINAIGREKITDVELGDQKERNMTVVFTDIRGYTAISEGMSPQENFAFVKEYAARMAPIIGRHRGFISQFLGDGIMAIFPEDATDAVIACLEMQEDISEYNKILISNGRDPITVGMGMDTGPLIMGIIGDDFRRDATLISDTVNTASRIESTTKRLKTQILLSENSVTNIHHPELFHLVPMGEISVRGKAQPITLFACNRIPEHDPSI